MALHNIEYNLQSDNRTDIRIEVAKLFTLEEPGIGKGENCSKYHYIVAVSYTHLTLPTNSLV